MRVIVAEDCNTRTSPLREVWPTLANLGGARVALACTICSWLGLVAPVEPQATGLYPEPERLKRRAGAAARRRSPAKYAGVNGGVGPHSVEQKHLQTGSLGSSHCFQPCGSSPQLLLKKTSVPPARGRW